MELNVMRDYILLTARDCHKAAAEGGWWTNPTDGSSLLGKRDFIAMCGLIVTEITEAYDGWLENAMDDKLPHRLQIEVELADAFIRAGDTSVGNGVNLAAGLAALGDAWAPFKALPSGGGSMAPHLMTIISYVSYAIEGHRKRDVIKRDTSMAKAMIAIIVLSANAGFDLRGAVAEKMAFNKVRPDHKLENRMKDGGKKE